MAAKTDNVDNILAAIANKINIDALGSDGRNALHWACTLHRTSICHVLLKKGASLSMKDVRPVLESWLSSDRGLNYHLSSSVTVGQRCTGPVASGA